MKQAGSKADGQSADPKYSEHQTGVLEGIGKAIEVEQILAQYEALNEQVELRAETALLPDAVADRTLRSENAISGHFNRVLDGLERYRRLRRRKSK